MLIHWVWFSERKLSNIQKRKLLEHFRDPEEIYYAGERLFEDNDRLGSSATQELCDRDLTSARKIIATCQEKGIRIITMSDSDYPSRLRSIVDPPMVLYAKGKLPDWDTVPVIGVVGTRKATPYGNRVALQLSNQIAACGTIVVSGGAIGIDTMALQGAISANRPAIAVLGCGVDVIYPKSNRLLFENVEKIGCLISEYPPGTEAYGWHFPERNRIIAGISNGLLVVEAPLKSGALITARLALEQGRDVFSVPGNLGISTSEGTNMLLQEGAKAILSGWDVVREYAYQYPGVIHNVPVQNIEPVQKESAKAAPITEKTDKKSIDNPTKPTYSVLNAAKQALTNEEKAVLACIDTKGVLIDAVIEQQDLPPGTVKSILTKLALKQYVVQHPGGRVSLK